MSHRLLCGSNLKSQIVISKSQHIDFIIKNVNRSQIVTGSRHDKYTQYDIVVAVKTSRADYEARYGH